MFDSLRNLTKSAEEKQQELLNAYLDEQLTPVQRQRFEKELAKDSNLQTSLRQATILKQQLRQLPRRPIPRSFQLDPVAYGRPQGQPSFRLYPAMRMATALTAFFFILAVAANLFVVQDGMAPLAAPSQDVAMVAEEAAEEPAALAVEVTRVVAEMEPVEEVVVETVTEVTVEAETIAEGEGEEPEAAALRTEAAAPAEEAVPVEGAAPAEAASAETAMEDADAATAVGESFAAETSTAAEVGSTAATAPAEPTGGEAAPTSAGAAQPTATMSALPRPSEPADDGERLGIVPQPTLVNDLDETAAATKEVEQVPPETAPVQQPLNGLRLIQVGLGVAVLLLGGLTYLLRRQG